MEVTAHAPGARAPTSPGPLTVPVQGTPRELVAVVAQEELLERGRLAHQGVDPERRQMADDVVEGGRRRPRRRRRARRRRARARRRAVSRPSSGSVGAYLDGGPGEVAQCPRACPLDRASLPDDRHPVTELLDLGEDVARQQHGAALGLGLEDAVLEHGLHQRVESRRRLVEQEQLGVRRRARRRGPPSGGCPWSRCGSSCGDRARSRSMRSSRLRPGQRHRAGGRGGR